MHLLGSLETFILKVHSWKPNIAGTLMTPYTYVKKKKIHLSPNKVQVLFKVEIETMALWGAGGISLIPGQDLQIVLQGQKGEKNKNNKTDNIMIMLIMVMVGMATME